ncbi:PREDICTED: uncharacterized protein LOC104701969 isoform X2 [Camelina sativa]|uniref:Uncharacterized protein LOC104701969 isoform X2 n=1 Tax=Camelina sativa TaxID=90675 RepID=A0ABM0STW3_CAMSA|nr:PREDICTED: uncharacterized protein LOC104701969 isoform X2 [Camelina sativa]
MRRRNHRTKADETLNKTDPQQIGFNFTDPSSSQANSDLKRRRRVSFDDDVDHHRIPLNEAQAGRSIDADAKTSEFAFFKKLKSGFGHSSESSSYDSNKASNKVVKQNPRTFESRVKPGERAAAATDCEANDRSKSCNFSTPIHSATRRENYPGKSSSSLSKEKDTVPSGSNLRSASGGISDEKGDIFFVKRKKLHQWIKDTWFSEIPEITSNGHDLVSVLLTRLFPGAEETHPSRLSKERTDRVKRRTFVDAPGSKFLKRSHESYREVDRSLQMEDRLIPWQGWLENNITPRLQYQTGHVQSSFIPRDPEEIRFPILYPKESVYRPEEISFPILYPKESFYRPEEISFPILYPKESVYGPPLLKQKACLSFPVEENLDSSPISSLHFRNYKPVSMNYHREDSGYSSEDLSHEHRDPSSAFLLEWNTETASTRKTDDFPLSYNTRLIRYPNASSSSLNDNPWSSDYSPSHDLVTRELYPLPLLSHDTSGSFFLPTTKQSNHFEPELERNIIDDEDAVAANQNLQTSHFTDSSDCLARDYTYYRNLSNSPVDHCHFKVPGCEIASFPFSSVSNSNLLKASSPTPNDRFKSHDWIPFRF